MMGRSRMGLRYCLIFLVAFTACHGASGQRSLMAQDKPLNAKVEQSAREPQDASDLDCKKLLELIEQQRSVMSREAGQIRREIAALRDEISRPGAKDVFAGIGYIFGLAGIGLYVHARKDRRK